MNDTWQHTLESQSHTKTTSVCPTWRKFICSFGQPSACIRFLKAKVKLTPRKRSHSLVRYVIGATRWLPVCRVSKAVQIVSSFICVCAAEHTVVKLLLFRFAVNWSRSNILDWKKKKKKSQQNETKLRDCRGAFATAHLFPQRLTFVSRCPFCFFCRAMEGRFGENTPLIVGARQRTGTRHFQFHSIQFYFLQPYFIVFSCEASGLQEVNREIRTCVSFWATWWPTS